MTFTETILNSKQEEMARVIFDSGGTIDFVSVYCDLTMDFHAVDMEHFHNHAVLYKKVRDHVDEFLANRHGGEDPFEEAMLQLDRSIENLREDESA